MSPTEWLLLQAPACVGLAIVVQKALESTSLGLRLLKHQPFSCGWCLTFWWGIAAFNHTLSAYNDLWLAFAGLGLASLAGALAIGLVPWAFHAQKS